MSQGTDSFIYRKSLQKETFLFAKTKVAEVSKDQFIPVKRSSGLVFRLKSFVSSFGFRTFLRLGMMLILKLLLLFVIMFVIAYVFVYFISLKMTMKESYTVTGDHIHLITSDCTFRIIKGNFTKDTLNIELISNESIAWSLFKPRSLAYPFTIKNTSDRRACSITYRFSSISKRKILLQCFGECDFTFQGDRVEYKESISMNLEIATVYFSEFNTESLSIFSDILRLSLIESRIQESYFFCKIRASFMLTPMDALLIYDKMNSTMFFLQDRSLISLPSISNNEFQKNFPIRYFYESESLISSKCISTNIENCEETTNKFYIISPFNAISVFCESCTVTDNVSVVISNYFLDQICIEINKQYDYLVIEFRNMKLYSESETLQLIIFKTPLLLIYHQLYLQSFIFRKIFGTVQRQTVDVFPKMNIPSDNFQTLKQEQKDQVLDSLRSQIFNAVLKNATAIPISEFIFFDKLVLDQPILDKSLFYYNGNHDYQSIGFATFVFSMIFTWHFMYRIWKRIFNEMKKKVLLKDFYTLISEILLKDNYTGTPLSELEKTRSSNITSSHLLLNQNLLDIGGRYFFSLLDSSIYGNLSEFLDQVVHFNKEKENFEGVSYDKLMLHFRLFCMQRSLRFKTPKFKNLSESLNKFGFKIKKIKNGNEYLISYLKVVNFSQEQFLKELVMIDKNSGNLSLSFFIKNHTKRSNHKSDSITLKSFIRKYTQFCDFIGFKKKKIEVQDLTNRFGFKIEKSLHTLIVPIKHEIPKYIINFQRIQQTSVMLSNLKYGKSNQNIYSLISPSMTFLKFLTANLFFLAILFFGLRIYFLVRFIFSGKIKQLIVGFNFNNPLHFKIDSDSKLFFIENLAFPELCFCILILDFIIAIGITFNLSKIKVLRIIATVLFSIINCMFIIGALFVIYFGSFVVTNMIYVIFLASLKDTRAKLYFFSILVILLESLYVIFYLISSLIQTKLEIKEKISSQTILFMKNHFDFELNENLKLEKEIEKQHLMDYVSSYCYDQYKRIHLIISQYVRSEFLVKAFSLYFAGEPYLGSSTELVNEVAFFTKSNENLELIILLTELFNCENVNFSNLIHKTSKLRNMMLDELRKKDTSSKIIEALKLCFQMNFKDLRFEELIRISEKVLEKTCDHSKIKYFSICMIEVLYHVAKHENSSLSYKTILKLIIKFSNYFGKGKNDRIWVEYIFGQIVTKLKIGSKNNLSFNQFKQINSIEESELMNTEEAKIEQLTSLVLDSLNNSDYFRFFDIPIVNSGLNLSVDLTKKILKILNMQSIIFRNQHSGNLLLENLPSFGPEEIAFSKVIPLLELKESFTENSSAPTFLLKLIHHQDLHKTRMILDILSVVFSRNENELKNIFDKHKLPYIKLFLYLKLNKYPNIEVAYRAFDQNRTHIIQLRLIQSHLRKFNKMINQIEKIEFFKLFEKSMTSELETFFDVFFMFRAISLNKTFLVISEVNIFFNSLIVNLASSCRERLFSIISKTCRILVEDFNESEESLVLEKAVTIAKFLKNPSKQNRFFFNDFFNISGENKENIEHLVLLLQASKRRQLFGQNKEENLSVIETQLSHMLFFHFTDSDSGILTWTAIEKLMRLINNSKQTRVELISSSESYKKHNDFFLKVDLQDSEIELISSRVENLFHFSEKPKPLDPFTTDDYKSLLTSVDHKFLTREFEKTFFNENLESGLKYYLYGILSGLTERDSFFMNDYVENLIQNKFGFSNLILRLFNPQEETNRSDLYKQIDQVVISKNKEENEAGSEIIASMFSPKFLSVIPELLKQDRNAESILKLFIEDKIMLKLFTFLVDLKLKNKVDRNVLDELEHIFIQKFSISLSEVIFFFRLATRQLGYAQINYLVSKGYITQTQASYLLMETKYHFPADERSDIIISKLKFDNELLDVFTPVTMTFHSFRRKNIPLSIRFVKKFVYEKEFSTQKISDLCKDLIQGFFSSEKAIKNFQIHELNFEDKLFQTVVFFHLKHADIRFIKFIFELVMWMEMWKRFTSCKADILLAKRENRLKSLLKIIKDLKEIFSTLLKRYFIFPSFSNFFEMLSGSEKLEIFEIFGHIPTESEYNYIINKSLFSAWLNESDFKLCLTKNEVFSNRVFKLSIQKVLNNDFFSSVFGSNQSLEDLQKSFSESIVSSFCKAATSLRTSIEMPTIPSKVFGSMFIGILLHRLETYQKFKSKDFKFVYPRIVYLTDILLRFVEIQIVLKYDRTIINRHELGRIFLANFGIALKKDQIHVFSVSAYAAHIYAYVSVKMLKYKFYSQQPNQSQLTNSKNTAVAIDITESLFKLSDFKLHFVQLSAMLKCWRDDKNKSLQMFETHEYLLDLQTIFSTTSFPDLTKYSDEFSITTLTEPIVYTSNLQPGITNEIVLGEYSPLSNDSNFFFEALAVQTMYLNYTVESPKLQKYFSISDLLTPYFGYGKIFDKKLEMYKINLKLYHKIADYGCKFDFKIKDLFENCPKYINFSSLPYDTQKLFRSIYNFRNMAKDFDQKPINDFLQNYETKLSSNLMLLTNFLEILLSSKISRKFTRPFVFLSVF